MASIERAYCTSDLEISHDIQLGCQKCIREWGVQGSVFLQLLFISVNEIYGKVIHRRLLHQEVHTDVNINIRHNIIFLLLSVH